MKLINLSYFLCPCCKGQLQLDESAVKADFSASGKDLQQGILGCLSCQTLFPVIAGIPILINPLEDWLRKNHSNILRGIHDCFRLSSDMLDWLNQREWSFGNQSQNNYYEDSRWLQIFIQTHFDPLRPGTDDPSPLGKALAQQEQVFEVCQEMLAAVIKKPVPQALDVGCNVGGMSYRLKPFAQNLLALDTAFCALLSAKRILHQTPKAISQGIRRIDGSFTETFDIDAQNASCDFLLSPLEQSHFTQTFDLITCLNVIDCVNNPEVFLNKLVSLLKPGGFLLLTSPYSWTSDDVPRDKWLTQTGLPSEQALQMLLEQKGMVLIEFRDHIPWVLTEHKRWYRVFSNHCILMQKN